MGLRELKAQRTRAAITAAALRLFEAQGYDATTMEQIAEAAEVAPTTLYRYFPTKDSTLVAHLIPVYGRLSAGLRERPDTEPLGRALGEALRARLRAADDDAERLLRVRAMIDSVPAARARVWDTWYQETEALERAIAERAHAQPSDLWVQLTARTCLNVMQLALDVRSPNGESAASEGERIIAELASGRPVTPTLD